MPFTTYANIKLEAKRANFPSPGVFTPIWLDTGINLTVGNQVRISATGTMTPYPGLTISPQGSRTPPTGTNVYLPYYPFCMLIGKIGVNGKVFPIGRKRNLGAVKVSGNLFITFNEVIDGLTDNSDSFSVTVKIGTPTPSSHEICASVAASCLIPSGRNRVMTVYPINLFDAEKREEITDMQVNTPGGTLKFTRVYRQSKLQAFDPEYRFMGLGWTHNHISKILSITGTSPARSMSVLLVGGGLLQLAATSANQFTALAGASAKVSFDTPSNEYRLITSGAMDFKGKIQQN